MDIDKLLDLVGDDELKEQFENLEPLPILNGLGVEGDEDGK